MKLRLTFLVSICAGLLSSFTANAQQDYDPNYYDPSYYDPSYYDPNYYPGGGGAGGCASTEDASIENGLTGHFQNWLQQNGYGEYDFVRDDLLLPGGSFGGKVSSSDCVSNQPVIYIHGNGDRCDGGLVGGFTKSAEYFKSQGYRSSELYCTTYGPANMAMGMTYYHSKEYVMHVRKFVEAVLAYTGAQKVDIITHSMGATLGRKVVKGGYASDMAAGGQYYVGAPLSQFVDTYVSIAGTHLGLVGCFMSGPTTPGCARTNGFYPGYMFWGQVRGVSRFLEDLNSTTGYEGDYRFSLWSRVDQLVGFGCLVWGKNTCQIPGQTGEKNFSAPPFGHRGLKDLTGYYQYKMVTEHQSEFAPGEALTDRFGDFVPPVPGGFTPPTPGGYTPPPPATETSNPFTRFSPLNAFRRFMGR